MDCRLMTESDIAAAARIYIDYYNSCEGGEWTPETARRRIHQVWSREDSLCLMLELRGEAIGFVMGSFGQYDDIMAYDLVEIVVARAWQGRGIGTRLMRLLEARVKELGGAMIQLEAVNDDMHNRFYGRLGYRDCTNLVLKSKWL